MQQLKSIHELYKKFHPSCEIKLSAKGERWTACIKEEGMGVEELSALGDTPEDAIIEMVFALIHTHRYDVVRDLTLIGLVTKLLKELNKERACA